MGVPGSCRVTCHSWTPYSGEEAKTKPIREKFRNAPLYLCAIFLESNSTSRRGHLRFCASKWVQKVQTPNFFAWVSKWLFSGTFDAKRTPSHQVFWLRYISYNFPWTTFGRVHVFFYFEAFRTVFRGFSRGEPRIPVNGGEPSKYFRHFVISLQSINTYRTAQVWGQS